MRIYLDLEACPPPMTDKEKLEALPESKIPKQPKEPERKSVPKNIRDKAKIASREAENDVVYRAAIAQYGGGMIAWSKDYVEAAEDYWRWQAVKPNQAVITVVGWSCGGYMAQRSGVDPATILRSFESELPRDADTCEWVTFNGQGYDLPLLWRWACKLRLERLRDAIPWSPWNPYQRRHIDFMGRQFISFDKVCQDYLGEGKQGSDDPVGDWLDPERRHLLLERNVRDVELLVMLDAVLR